MKKIYFLLLSIFLFTNLIANENLEEEIFTKEELEYIKNKKSVKVGIDFWRPLYFIRKNKKIDGLSGDYLNLISKVSGLKFVPIEANWETLLNKIKNEEIDVLPAVYYTKQREEFGLYSDSYIDIRSAIFVNSNNDEIKKFEDLFDKKIAMVKLDARTEKLKKEYPNLKIIETINVKESISLLLEKKVDATIDSELVVHDLLKKELITDIKSIFQNKIKTEPIHFFIKKSDSLLHTIFQKSLKSINNKEKNRIISDWLSQVKVKKSLNIAFGLGREPYVLNKNNIKGIEYDLISHILHKENIRIQSTQNFEISELNKLRDSESKFDVIVNVNQRDDNLFYSDDFISFENVVISKVKDQIFINNVEDLRGKKLGSFINAYKYLGEKYKNIFAPENRKSNYKEYSNQYEQVKDFVDGKLDLLIIDKTIFKWYIKQINKKSSFEKYRFDYIFPSKNSFKIAFKNEYLRDIFNSNLKYIKEKGIFDKVFEDYINGFIDEKHKIKSILASIIGKYLFTDEIEELERILEKFLSINVIDKIEVYDLENEKIIQKGATNSETYYIQDIYHFIVNNPHPMGYLKIYYSNDFKSDISYVPDFSAFKNLSSSAFIKEIYKKYGYLYKKIEFSEEEKEFIKNNPIISFSEVSWKPLSIIKSGNYYGLINDYLEIIEEKTGLDIKFEEIKSWSMVLEGVKSKEIDLIPITNTSKELFSLGYLTRELTSFPYAIVANSDVSFVGNLKNLKNKKVVVPKGFSSQKYLEQNYPNIEIIEANSVDDALYRVSKNSDYVFLGNMAVSIFHIKNYFPSLKIIGVTKDEFGIHFLVNKENRVLEGIIDKVIASITFEQRQKIRNKWIQAKVSSAIDYNLIYQIVAVFTIILIIILAFLRKLSLAKEDILQKSKDLKEQKEVFETLFYDTADPISLIKDGAFIDCNNSFLEKVGFESKSDFMNIKPHEISPSFQADGESSKTKAEDKINECLKNGRARFEWLHIKRNGDEFWVDVSLTKIKLHKQDIVHVVWKDITDKKILEEQIISRNDELEMSNHELEVSIENLKKTQDHLVESEKMASLGSLVAGVAHEVNTPIGISLTGSTHFQQITKTLVRKYEKDEMTQEDFEDFLKTSSEVTKLININLKRAANLVKSFKQVAVDQTSEERREFEINEYIDEILASIYNVTKKRDIKILVNSPKDIKINTYPGALSQIVTNLIMNSLIHGYKEEDSGEISIDVKVLENEIELLYKDNGKGIDKKNLSKIFDPFFTTNRKNGGSGLGLNIVYNIVNRKLGGKITCQSEIGKGVEFCIKFPF